MLERLIEDWLANVTERQFEIPFAQLLHLDGYQVIHHARPHGPMEQGKDILAVDSSGKIHAYQLKQGNLGLKDWREGGIKGQVEDLLDLAIQHPSVPVGTSHISHLLTTGLLDDTLRQTISQFNQQRRDLGKSELRVITKGELKEGILSKYHEFFPFEADLFKVFLQLITADPRGLCSKKDLVNFQTLLADNFLGSNKSKTQFQRFGTYFWIIISQISHFYELKENWIGAIEVWVTGIATLQKVSISNDREFKDGVFDIPLIKISNLMSSYLDEMAEIPDLHFNGASLEDGLLVSHRITLCLGWISASLLYLKSRGEIEESRFEHFNQKINNWISEMFYWGESACPYFLAVFWYADRFNPPPLSDQLLFRLLDSMIAILRHSKKESPLVREEHLDPYTDINSSVENYISNISNRLKGGVLPKSDSFHSYYMESLVLLIASRLWRQSLASRWTAISDIDMSRFNCGGDEDFWNWEAKSGKETSWSWPTPTSWAWMLEKSRNINQEKLPKNFGKLGAFHLLHLMVFPHRVNSDLVLKMNILNKNNWA